MHFIITANLQSHSLEKCGIHFEVFPAMKTQRKRLLYFLSTGKESYKETVTMQSHSLNVVRWGW